MLSFCLCDKSGARFGFWSSHTGTGMTLFVIDEMWSTFGWHFECIDCFATVSGINKYFSYIFPPWCPNGAAVDGKSRDPGITAASYSWPEDNRDVGFLEEKNQNHRSFGHPASACQNQTILAKGNGNASSYIYIRVWCLLACSDRNRQTVTRSSIKWIFFPLPLTGLHVKVFLVAESILSFRC